MKDRLLGFARFWYHFFVGDDATFAVGVVAALAATYGLSRTPVAAWWITPAVALIVLAGSIFRKASVASSAMQSRRDD